MKFYCETIETVLKSTNSSAEGLTTAEAEKRLAENGKNKLKEGKKDSLFVKVMAGILAGLMLVSVVAIALIYFLQ